MGLYISQFEASEGIKCPKCGSQDIIALTPEGDTFLCQVCAHIFGQGDIFGDSKEKDKE